MVIEISKQTPPLPPSAQQSTQQQMANTMSKQQQNMPPPGDNITFTESATLLLQLESQIAELPIVDTQRVELIRSELKADRFEINPVRVAEKMLQFEQTLENAA